jgi:uroporphyrinogen decarboxylase
MTSRERVLAALDRRPVDRVPIDVGGTRQSGISAWTYARLRDRLGLPPRPPRVFDLFQMLAEIDQDVADRFGADCVGLNRPSVAFSIPNRDWKPFRFADGLVAEVPGGFAPDEQEDGRLVLRRNGEAIGAMPAASRFFDRFEKYPGALHPDLSTWRAPRLDGATLEHYHRESEALHANTDKAIVAALGPPYELFNGIGQGGFEAWMCTFGSEPEYVEALYAELVDAWIENLAAFHAAVGDRIHVLQIADDFGTQTAPFLSPRMFRRLVLPAYRRGLDWVHAHTAWKVLLHSDGALYPLLPSIIEMGVDILNPVQTSAAGMDPVRLKQEFGDRLGFWGASADPQSTLVRGTPAEVAAEAERHLSIFSPGGGYVFASIHNVQADVPADNVVALYDAALAFRPASMEMP